MSRWVVDHVYPTECVFGGEVQARYRIEMHLNITHLCDGSAAGKVIGNNQMCLLDTRADPIFLVNGCKIGLEGPLEIGF